MYERPSGLEARRAAPFQGALRANEELWKRPVKSQTMTTKYRTSSLASNQTGKHRGQEEPRLDWPISPHHIFFLL